MLALTTSWWWLLGYVIAAVVVALAAALLLAIIALARRIAGQADEIVAALEGTHANTAALFDVAEVNYSLEQLHRAVKAARGEQSGGSEQKAAGIVDRLSRRIRGRS